MACSNDHPEQHGPVDHKKLEKLGITSADLVPGRKKLLALLHMSPREAERLVLDAKRSGGTAVSE
jgi:hypothetical protein